jgi:hypothetical protein
MYRTPFLIATGMILLLAGTRTASAQQQISSPKGSNSKTGDAIRISRETTFVTGPLDANGRVNYAAAVNQHFSHGVTPQNNAAVLLYQAMGPNPGGVPLSNRFFEGLGMPRPVDDGNYIKGLRRSLPDASDEELVQISAQMDVAMTRPWAPDEFPEIVQWMEINQEPLALVEQAVQRPMYFSPWVVEPPQEREESPGGLIGVLLPGIQQSREIARLLACRALFRMKRGDLSGAWRDIVTTRRLGRLVGQGPSLVEDLVGIAIEGIARQTQFVLLQQAALNPDQIRAIGSELDLLPPRRNLAERFNYGERLMFLDTVQIMSGGDSRVVLGIIGSRHSQLLKLLSWLSIDWNVVMLNGNQWYDRIIEALAIEDYSRRREALARLNEVIEQWREDEMWENPWPGSVGIFFTGRQAASERIADILVSLLLPAAGQIQNAEDRATQHDRNLRVATALALYRSEHDGQYPETLDALSPQYLDEVPDDLFTGEALRYRLEAGGFVLYSPGRDGIDNGGIDSGKAGNGDDLVIRFEK